MARRPKASGRSAPGRCRDSREFIARVERGGGRIEYANGGGSHFWGHAPDGTAMRAYDTNGGEYPKGLACVLGKWLAAAGLVLAIAVAVGCM